MSEQLPSDPLLGYLKGQAQASVNLQLLMSIDPKAIFAFIECAEALRWYVENDDVSVGMPGNEFWTDGHNRGKAAIAQLEALCQSK